MECQKAKITKHNRPPIASFPVPTARFEHVHIDIVGPLPEIKGMRYILTCIDRFSRWPEAVPLDNIEADTIARSFIHLWVARFGVPTKVTTDQGRQFESQLFGKLEKLLGFTRQRTTAYHPQANGLVERFHRHLKGALMCHEEPWTDVLPMVLLGIRTAWKEDIKATAAEMIYGETLRIPGDFISNKQEQLNVEPEDYVIQLRRHIRKLQPTPTSRHGVSKVFTFKDLETTTHVFVRNDTVRRPLQPPYEGPYEVVKRSKQTFQIRKNGKLQTITAERVKPAFIESTPEEISTPTTVTHTPPETTRAGRTIKQPVRFRD